MLSTIIIFFENRFRLSQTFYCVFFLKRGTAEKSKCVLVKFLYNKLRKDTSISLSKYNRNRLLLEETNALVKQLTYTIG